jgi:dihydroorotate dehydrogenase (fumarate)
LKFSIRGVDFESCVYNASGPSSHSKDELLKIEKSQSAAVVSKTATLLPQDGNTNAKPCGLNKVELGTGYCCGSLNSEGVYPNKGIDYYIREDIVASMIEHGKPYIVSIAARNIDDDVLPMLDKILNVNKIFQTKKHLDKDTISSPAISAVELNLSCCNLEGESIVAYTPALVDSVLRMITTHKLFLETNTLLGVKLPPFNDMNLLHNVAHTLAKYSEVSFVVSVNPVANALLVDSDTESASIPTNEGLGGLGGGFIKHTALANVRQLYLAFNEQLNRTDMAIIGVGGISSGQDAFEFILCGATAVQIGQSVVICVLVACRLLVVVTCRGISLSCFICLLLLCTVMI